MQEAGKELVCVNKRIKDDCYLKEDFGVSDLCNKIMPSKNLRSVYVFAEEFEDL